MKKPIRLNMTVKASSIHDSTNIYDCAGTHERTTTPPRIFRPLFQTKDSPSLGRRSSELMSRFLSRSMSRPISITAIVFLAILLNAIIGTISGISSNNTFATSSINVTIANTISLDIMPKSTYGTFARSSTSDNTVSVSTDNYTGYILGIAASTTNDNALSYKVNDTIVDSIASHSIVAGVSSTNYANDTYAASNSLNNTWGYRPSTYYDTTNNTNVDNITSDLYFPAPTSTSVTTLAKTTTANPSEADNYNIAIGARVGIDKTPGAYTNTLVITVVANATPYSLTYDANAGGDSTVANMPSGVVGGTSYADTITLSSTVPTRTGYTFAGWCVTNTSQTSCSGTLYNSTNNNLDSFPIDRTASSNSLNAYAIWTVNTYSLAITFAGSGVSSVKVCAVSGDCTGANLKGTVSTSGDSVSGLAYGTAYYLYPAFTSGYELDNWSKTDSTTGAVLSSTSGTNPTYTIGEGNGAVTITGKSAVPGLCTDADHCMQISTATCGNNMVDSRTGVSYLTATINNQCYMEQNLYLPTNLTLTSADSNVTRDWTTPSSDSIPSNSYTTAYMKTGAHTNNTYNVRGGWYNYCAASAGTVCSQTQANADEDVCPAGWRLPTSGEMTNVKNANRSNWKFYAGYYYGGSLQSASSYSFWWSATAISAYVQYSLGYSSGSLGTDYSSSKNFGFFVRCIRK